MFRRIVSNLAFSPALVGQLGFYARRLRKEESTRRIGLVFTALALMVQSLAVFSPPEAANAATPGQVGSSPRCEVNAVGPRGSAFTITQGGEAVVDFDISGPKDCKVQVSANSFFAPSMNGRPYEKQILHERNTKIFDTPGRYMMKTSLPAQSNQSKGCFYQVDLTYGTFNVLPVLAYGHGKLNCDSGTPTAGTVSCTQLSIIKASPTRFTLRGKANATNLAIDRYVFTITKPNGEKIERIERTKAASASVDYENDSPGTYQVKLTVYGAFLRDTNNACSGSFTVPGPPTPNASCNSVSATIVNRTQAYFKGSAQASNGAKITRYTFVVKNGAGVEVKRVNVNSSSTSAATSAVDIRTPGKYSVQLIVRTSLGDKTNSDSCIKRFTVVPPNVCPYNPTLPPNSPDCQPCPDNPDVWVKDEECEAEIISTKTATNISQGNVEASSVSARAGDKLSYTITVENRGLAPETTTLQEELTDVLEYATLVDQGGGEYNEQTKTVTWPAITLRGGQKQSRTIAVQLLNSVPSTNTGTGIPTSYDCKMTNTFGNSIDVNVDCPPEKVIVEQVVKELPQTGPRENMLFAGALLAVVVYFYARSKQLGKEVRLIRRGLNTGTI